MTTKQKHILLVTQYFWPESFRVNDLAAGLVEKGYRVTVLTGQPNYPHGTFYNGYGFFSPLTENYMGAKIIRMPLIPRGKNKLGLILNYLSFAFLASILAPFRCRERYDVVFVYQMSPVFMSFPAIVMKKIKKIPMIHWVQDLWPEGLSATGMIRSKTIINIVRDIVKFIYQNCDLILVQSQAFVQPVMKLGVDQSKIAYYPASAEEIYQPIVLGDNTVERTQISEGFNVMFAGNVGILQDFPNIIGAAEKLKDYKDIHFNILGDGRMLPWVKSEIEKKGLTNVHLLGRYPIEAMPGYFSLADVMLVTLIKEPIISLTIPNKVQSYLACAKPIIAALDGEGGRVVEESGAGIAVPAENPEKLAEAILKFYNIPKKDRDSMGIKAREYFEANFERTMLIKKLDTWIQQIK